MWKQISCKEKCDYLIEHNKSMYTVPDVQGIYDNPDRDVTFYSRKDHSPKILIKKGWNDRGLWEITYHKWVTEDSEEGS